MAVETRRATDIDRDQDDPLAVLDLLARGATEGRAGAMVTLVGIDGGAPRALGAQMAVLEDGRYCGYVSGGCVEAAVAAEAVKLIAEGRNGALRFGRNSPFIDIRLPCGGGIDLQVHTTLDPAVIAEARALSTSREPFAIRMHPVTGGFALASHADTAPETGWQDGWFVRRFAPATRLLLLGGGAELPVMARTAAALGLEVYAQTPDERLLDQLAMGGAVVEHLSTPDSVPDLPVDPWTAAVVLFHDADWETPLLERLVGADAFFLGALGSRNTHRERCERLRERGVAEADIERIHGPIGLFGPARDSGTLALSVLAQVAETRMRFDPR